MRLPRPFGIYKSRLTDLRAVVVGRYESSDSRVDGFVLGHEDMSQWGIATKIGFWDEYEDTEETWTPVHQLPPAASE